MPGWMAWVQEPSDMIKMRKEVQALSVKSVNITLIKLGSVLLERISVNNLNHYVISAKW
jgi:hypothetical protein